MRNVSCLNNLKQWGIATALYAAENSDALPPEGVPNLRRRPPIQVGHIQLPRQLNLTPYHEMPWRTNAAHAARSDLPDNPRRSNGRISFTTA